MKRHETWVTCAFNGVIIESVRGSSRSDVFGNVVSPVPVTRNFASKTITKTFTFHLIQLVLLLFKLNLQLELTSAVGN